MFGVELFQEVKSFKGKIESTLEHMKSVESEIIKIQKQTNQMFRQVVLTELCGSGSIVYVTTLFLIKSNKCQYTPKTLNSHSTET
ncbi:hypothetical protein BLOT_007924 [Blomia tropicalis]|nr:hypothetical protein BLOT_007924 [Blomia tropicalis]